MIGLLAFPVAGGGGIVTSPVRCNDGRQHEESGVAQRGPSRRSPREDELDQGNVDLR
jgi:hypothetical protein